MIIEPSKKNTAPSILSVSIMEKHSNSLILMLPSDHIIKNTEVFLKDIIEAKLKHNSKKLTIFGIKPKKVETGYGYIKVNKIENDKYLKFEKFIEKPNLTNAKKYFQNKNYLWNSGLILFSPKCLIELYSYYDSRTLKYVNASVNKGKIDLNFLGWKKKLE